jgi:hypothetical protein
VARKLPVVCPGCGAPSQTVDADAAGFYGSRRAGKATQKSAAVRQEDEAYQNAFKTGLLSDGAPETPSQPAESPDIPICDRCHYLLYQSRGSSIIHPSMQSIQQIIEESPHKHNHIYHVLDAADFPMSLIPNLITALRLPRLRTRNRRSKSMQYVRGRVAEVSFIITRSDLLAPKKEQVDSLVPYLREVLREALGRAGRDIRLGNVRCVSAQRGWWTKTVKEEIYSRGGAGWVVGKVNVGKSALYEVVFPKGRNQDDVNLSGMRQREASTLEKNVGQQVSREGGARFLDHGQPGTADLPGEFTESDGNAAPNYSPEGFQESELDLAGRIVEEEDDEVLFDDDSLLPPAQTETAFPRMPIVSALPGTTASPIRIPFGNGKGELIDLPGIHRSSLDAYVQPEHRNELVMKTRIVPEQYSLKPGQSILLGGLIRITPKTDDLVVLAYPFVPLKPHVTSTDKAIAIQTGAHLSGEEYAGSVSTITTPEAQSSVRSAGNFQLAWDVTKRRSGPLTSSAAGKQKAANLPFTIYGADILIEGVGWVEVTCQIRKGRPSFISETVVDAFGEQTVKREVEGSRFPEVEVWSPEGKFVAIRKPMNAWVLGGPKKASKKKRPRMTISYQRRKEGGARGGSHAKSPES